MAANGLSRDEVALPDVRVSTREGDGMLRRLRAVELLRILLVGSLLLPACIFALLAWLTERAAFADAAHELTWTSEVAREHASKVFDSYELVADRVQDLLAAQDPAALRPSEGVLSRRFKNMIVDLPQIESLIVLDKDGHLAVATESYPVDRSIDFSDRDYFGAMKMRAVGTYISKVQTSRVTNRTFFGWGRALKGSDGAFDGVIDIAVSPAFLQRFYATLASEIGQSAEGRTVTMIRSDGQFLVRYPDAGPAPPLVPRSNSFFAAIQANPEGGLYRNRSVIDAGAPERLFAFRKVPGQPIYIVAGRSLDAIRAEWAWSLFRYLAVGLPGTVALFLVTLATLRGARRERDALAQLRAEMTRREQAESQLWQAQKMDAAGQLTGGIAHDFNNLLTVIRSSVDLLSRPHLSEERRRRYVEAIADTADRATRLTSQLLAFARRQALQPEVFDVAANVAALTEMLRTLLGPRIAIVTRQPGAPLLVKADPSQFDTSLVNLAVNARDAMGGEGKLTLVVRQATEIPALRARLAVPGDYVAVSLADTGSGIAPDQLDAVFEPFFTTKRKGEGTGLGLSQVFGFAKQSGGDVTVESAVGEGTTVTLYLPRTVEPSERRRAAAEPEADLDGRGACVLVVEDDPHVGRTVADMLAELGCTPVLVATPLDVPAVLAREGDRFDMVFSDVVMPGMSGIDLGRQIRRLYPDLPVVLTSGYSDVLAEQGPSGFELLQKPYSREQLVRILGRALSHRRRRAGPQPEAGTPVDGRSSES